MRTILCLLLVLFPMVAHAQERPPVGDALTQWVSAIESKDAAKAVALYGNDAVMLSAFAIDPITTRDGLLSYYKKVVAEPDININVTKQDIREFGDVAMNTGLYRFQWAQDGEPMDVPARFSFVYQLQGGKWIIISHHSSVVPGKEDQIEESVQQ